jgi:cytochrome c biogenesis protein CcmG/thiol:disulfide interchange protein DsbE
MVVAAVLLLGLAGVVIALWGFPGADTRVPPIVEGGSAAPLQGAAAPNFTLADVSGADHRLSALRGHPVLINFWATWCEPCRLEMPSIQARYQRYREAGLEVLAVDFDEPKDGVTAFGRELGLEFPLLLDPGGAIQRLYQVRGYPTSYFVDRQGVIQVVQIGVMTEGQLDRNLAAIGVGG